MGELCARGYFYKIGYKDEGSIECAAYQAGQDRGDAALGLLMDVQSFYKLRVRNNAAVPVAKVDITAAAVAIFDSLGQALVVKNFSTTVNCSVNGANGLDVGAVGTNWYGFYVIGKADGTVAGLASLSLTNPTMPTGYIYKKLVSVIYAQAAALKSIEQVDRKVYNNDVGISAYTTTSALMVEKSLVTTVPPNALMVLFQPYVTNASWACHHLISWDSGNVKQTAFFNVPVMSPSFPGLNGVGDSRWYLLNPSAPQTIWAQGYDGNLRGGCFALGYELDL